MDGNRARQVSAAQTRDGQREQFPPNTGRRSNRHLKKPLTTMRPRSAYFECCPDNRNSKRDESNCGAVLVVANATGNPTLRIAS